MAIQPEQPDFNAILGDQIRTEMFHQKVTQRELASRLGWTQTSVSRRLQGKTSISVNDALNIAKALNVTLVSLGFPLTTTSGAGVRS